MKLDEWLIKEKLTQVAFAERLGVHPVTVSKWASDKMMPRRGQFRKISQVTGNQVTANDFMAVPSEEKAVG